MMSNDWRNNSSYRFYNDRYRPSSPIEVPSRIRPTNSFSLSPGNWSSSTELVFDMSPMSQEYSSMHFNSMTLQPARRENERDLFHYHLPILGPRSYRPSQSDPRPEDFSPSATNKVLSPISTENYQYTSAATAVHSKETHKQDFSVSTAAPETTKIVGFSPTFPHQPAGSSEEHKVKKLPFPPPRRMPASSSSWIIAGRSEEEDSSPRNSSDSGILDFKNYLLRRIDDKKTHLFSRDHAMAY